LLFVEAGQANCLACVVNRTTELCFASLQNKRAGA